MRGRKEGLWLGFFSGLLIDIFFGFYIGAYALIYMYIGYANGKFNMIFYPEDIKLPLALLFVSDMAYGLLSYIILFLMRGRFHFTYYLIHIILPEMVYTIVVTLIFYPFLLWINKKLESLMKQSIDNKESIKRYVSESKSMIISMADKSINYFNHKLQEEISEMIEAYSIRKNGK